MLYDDLKETELNFQYFTLMIDLCLSSTAKAPQLSKRPQNFAGYGWTRTANVF